MTEYNSNTKNSMKVIKQQSIPELISQQQKFRRQKVNNRNQWQNLMTTQLDSNRQKLKTRKLEVEVKGQII